LGFQWCGSSVETFRHRPFGRRKEATRSFGQQLWIRPLGHPWERSHSFTRIRGRKACGTSTVGALLDSSLCGAGCALLLGGQTAVRPNPVRVRYRQSAKAGPMIPRRPDSDDPGRNPGLLKHSYASHTPVQPALDQPKLAIARRVMVATDRSETADSAVRWAASFAERCGAELCLVQVVVPREPLSPARGTAERARAETARGELAELATRLAGQRGRALVVVDEDPAAAIVRAAEQEESDILVVGNLGMSGRKEFLLRNVPNRVSHKARCTVIIVNSAMGHKRPPMRHWGLRQRNRQQQQNLTWPRGGCRLHRYGTARSEGTL